MAQVFISYSADDAEKALAIYEVLKQEGISCWIAAREIPAGSNWGDAIVDAIRSCRAVVLVLSRSAGRSHNVRDELRQAFDHEKTVIPFRVEAFSLSGELDLMLRRVHWLEAFDGPPEEHLKRLTESVKRAVVDVPPSQHLRDEDLRTSRQEPELDKRRGGLVRWTGVGLVALVLAGFASQRMLQGRARRACSDEATRRIRLTSSGSYQRYYLCSRRFFVERVLDPRATDEQCQVRLARAQDGGSVKLSKVLSLVVPGRPTSWSQSVEAMDRHLSIALVGVERTQCEIELTVR